MMRFLACVALLAFVPLLEGSAQKAVQSEVLDSQALTKWRPIEPRRSRARLLGADLPTRFLNQGKCTCWPKSSSPSLGPVAQARCCARCIVTWAHMQPQPQKGAFSHATLRVNAERLAPGAWHQ